MTEREQKIADYWADTLRVAEHQISLIEDEIERYAFCENSVRAVFGLDTPPPRCKLH